MFRSTWRAASYLVLPCALAAPLCAATPLTWEQVRDRFRANNPALQAGQIGIRQSRAEEITAGLRPNPIFTSVNDEFLLFNLNRFRPFSTSQWTESVEQLIERRNKRGLRVESARLATSQAQSDQADAERQMLFGLRDAFVRALQARSLLELAQGNLDYYDKVLNVNRERYKAGDIAQVDLTRLELQRAQFESDLVTARVNLRSSKIAVLALLNDRSPVDDFDLEGEFAWREIPISQQQARDTALDARPDLLSSALAIRKAEADHKLAWANGSWDPQVGLEYQRMQSDNTLGFGITIPIRIFDRNQGEKERTALEIRRTQRLRENLLAGIYRDVDSAYAGLESVRDLLLPYRDRYLPQAAQVRDTVSFAYNQGGASLLDFLDAQKSYRDTQLAYRNLVGNYLSALNQLSLAIGKEVLP